LKECIGGCAGRVTAALEGVKGVKLGSVEVGSAQMTFYPNQASAEEIAAAVNPSAFPEGENDADRRCRIDDEVRCRQDSLQAEEVRLAGG
jgi:copper chaperone CopZ